MRHTFTMQSAFGTVLWIVCGCGIAIGLVALLSSHRAWDDYGRNQLVMDHEALPGARRAPAAVNAERDDEIRQLLQARNARRARRGEPPLDVEAELHRLTTPVVDEQLRAEIRELAIARNHRRARLGKPPLDVDAEVEREIREVQALR